MVSQPTEGRRQQGGWRSLCGQLSLQVTVPSAASPEARALLWVALCADWGWSHGGGRVGRTGRAGGRVKLSTWFSEREREEQEKPVRSQQTVVTVQLTHQRTAQAKRR